MEEAIELTFESPDGIIDCRLEPVRDEDGLHYSATILYPNMVNGYNRSDIYCHDVRRNRQGVYAFDSMDENIHPKIRKLEAQIAEAVSKL